MSNDDRRAMVLYAMRDGLAEWAGKQFVIESVEVGADEHTLTRMIRQVATAAATDQYYEMALSVLHEALVQSFPPKRQHFSPTRLLAEILAELGQYPQLSELIASRCLTTLSPLFLMLFHPRDLKDVLNLLGVQELHELHWPIIEADETMPPSDTEVVTGATYKRMVALAENGRFKFSRWV